MTKLFPDFHRGGIIQVLIKIQKIRPRMNLESQNKTFSKGLILLKVLKLTTKFVKYAHTSFTGALEVSRRAFFSAFRSSSSTFSNPFITQNELELQGSVIDSVFSVKFDTNREYTVAWFFKNSCLPFVSSEQIPGASKQDVPSRFTIHHTKFGSLNIAI